MATQMFPSAEAALVFFDWLTRFTASTEFDRLEAAEQRVLWDLEADLEKSLPVVLAADYTGALARARSLVEGSPEE